MLLSTRTKNLINKATSDCAFSLKNIVINGQKRGCSGFIRKGDRIVYINTEPSCLASCNFLHRYAKDEKDYRGGRNRFAKNEDEFIKDIVYMLDEERDVHWQGELNVR